MGRVIFSCYTSPALTQREQTHAHLRFRGAPSQEEGKERNNFRDICPDRYRAAKASNCYANQFIVYDN